MNNQINLPPELGQLLDSIPIAALFLDSSGACKFANQAWESLTGIPRNEALGNGWSLLVADSDASTLAQSLSNLLKERKSTTLDLRYKVASGNVVWTKVYFQTMAIGNDNVSGFLVSLFDVDPLLSKIQALEKQNKDLDNLNRLLIDRELKMVELKGIIKKMSK